MTSNEIRIARVLAPITALGPGRRVGIWVQGCTLACRGCASVDTWDRDGGQRLAVPELAQTLLGARERHDAAGLTITGGEPFQQSPAVTSLVRLLREADEEIDVLIFTGYTAAAAQRVNGDLWDEASAVVAGPYRPDQPAPDALLASGNQQLIVNDDRLAARYDDYRHSRPSLQAMVTDRGIQLVGLPDSGDLDRFAGKLRDSGVDVGRWSWSA